MGPGELVGLVGLPLGFTDGKILGLSVGVIEGDDDGDSEGEELGVPMGPKLGVIVGILGVVGADVGTTTACATSSGLFTVIVIVAFASSPSSLRIVYVNDTIVTGSVKVPVLGS